MRPTLPEVPGTQEPDTPYAGTGLSIERHRRRIGFSELSAERPAALRFCRTPSGFHRRNQLAGLAGKTDTAPVRETQGHA